MARTEIERSSDRRLLWGACAFVALLPILFHLPFISGQSIVYSADTAQLQYPRYKILCDALQHEGGLPLWQTWLYGGSPFHANPENPTLYPPVLLFAWFCTPIWTINLTILTHLSLAALGMFFLVRRVWARVDPDAGSVAIGGAIVGACVFSLSFWTRSDHLNLVAYGATHALIPWVLLAAEALLDGPRPLRAAGWLGLLFGLQILTGGLYVIPYAALSLLTWMLVQGVCGGRARAKRALTYGVLAAITAALIVAAKYFPYREWVAVTNRAARLDYSEALGQTLGSGKESFWSEVGNRVVMYTFFGMSIGLALLALPLLRSGVVRLAFALAIGFFAIALGGPVHRFLYDYLPIFDSTRNALRAWSGVNAFLPLLAGLGVCWFLSRFSKLRAAPPKACVAGAMLAAAIAPLLCYSFRHDENLKHPDRFEEILSRYTNWPAAAQKCGAEWRAMYVDRITPDTRNEQFISTALEVETPVGYLGHVWPSDLERHLYGEPSAPIEDVQRYRRRSTLSVRWLISTSHEAGAAIVRKDIVPDGVDGNLLVENELARPRAIEPSVVAAVYGDPDCKIAYLMLDSGTFPLLEASTLQLRPDRELSPQELSGIDALILRGPHSPQADRAANAMRASGKRVLEVAATLSEADIAGVHSIEHDCLAVLAETREPAIDRFVRLASDTTVIERADPTRGRWLVVSEPWSTYEGWSASAKANVALAIERADGISSAVFVPAGELSLRAHYAPESVRIGLRFLAAGWVLALALILWPARAKP
jgi:hypothetical protein